MTITNTELVLRFFDESDNPISSTPSTPVEIDLLNDPFYLVDESLDIGFPEKGVRRSSDMGYRPIFGKGVDYGPREVRMTLAIKDFSHAQVQRLFRWAERLNYLSAYVKHPLMELYVKYGEENGNTYAGYLKVVDADLEPSQDLYSVERTYNQSTLGQRHQLTLECDAFFYEDTTLYNIYEDIEITYPNTSGSDWTTSNVADIVPTQYPTFYVEGDSIRGDVPSPVAIEIYNANTRGDAGASSSAETLAIGTNYIINYNPPANVTTDYNFVWTKPWDTPSEDLFFEDGDAITHKLSGHVYAFLIFTSTSTYTAGVYTVRIRDAHSPTNFYDYGHVIAGADFSGTDVRPIGIMHVPRTGTPLNNFHVRTSTTYAAVLIPAWNIRVYNPIDFGDVSTLVNSGNRLVDDPYSDIIAVNNTDMVYHGVGNGLYVVPEVGMRGGLMAFDFDSIYGKNLQLRLRYKPRYLMLRNII